MKSLKLFNAVLAKKNEDDKDPYVSTDGYIIEPSALWAKDRIISYYDEQKLNGNELNKTFHKSWKKIKESTREELFIHQILHYMSTYGTGFKDDCMYIPMEELDIPELDIDKNKLKFKVIKGYTRDEFIEKSLDLLSSGIALKGETIDDLLSFLHDTLDYQFTGEENINNKEAVVKLAEDYNVYPNDPVEFLRYIVYRTTDDALLIKSDEKIKSIKESTFDPTVQFKQFGLKKLSTIFNRFKPLFLAYKDRSSTTINKISKLSKKHHKPMVQNPLNNVTSNKLSNDDMHWLDNATVFSLFKALNACYSRAMGQTHFIYNIRNGKSWAEENTDINVDVCEYNYAIIKSYLDDTFDLSDLNIYEPDNIDYALPTSEKMFVGNVPAGTKISSDQLAVGMYWENKWGARDLDLSGITNEGAKIGWNAHYNQSDMLYSGDMTNASDGAVEYVHALKSYDKSSVIKMNVYSGDNDAGYKIVVGDGDDIDNQYMMNPNNLILEEKTECVQREMILGLLISENDKQSFIIINNGLGNLHVSSYSELSDIVNNALREEWTLKLSFKDVIKDLGATFVDDKDDADIDLSINNIEKDTFIDIFKV